MRRQEVKSSTIRDVEKQAAASDEKRQESVSSNSNNKLALVNSYSKGSGEGARKPLPRYAKFVGNNEGALRRKFAEKNCSEITELAAGRLAKRLLPNNCYGRKRPSTSICSTPGGAGGGAESKDHHHSALLPPARLPQPMLLALTPSLLHGIESNRINFSFTTNPCRGVSALLFQWCSILLADLDFVHAVKM